MYNIIAKASLVATSLAPIMLVISVIQFSKTDNNIIGWHAGWGWFFCTLFMVYACFCLVRFSSTKIDTVSIKIKAIKTVDKEITSFLLVYLLPIIGQTYTDSIAWILVVCAMLYFIMMNSHTYHFNPLLNFFGYHFYEVTTERGITYVLITKQTIINCMEISQVVPVTEYMMLDPSHVE